MDESQINGNVYLKNNYILSNGAKSSSIINATVKKTEIHGLVRVTGLLFKRAYRAEEMLWASFGNFGRPATQEQIDSTLGRSWPRKLVSTRKLSIFESVMHYIDHLKWVREISSYEYDEYFDYKEPIDIIVNLNQIEAIIPTRDQSND